MRTHDAYPLEWPAGWPRHQHRNWAKFDTTVARARDGLLHEIKLMGGTDVVISTNVKTNRDGILYTTERQPADPGVAIYFRRRGKPMSLACDRWRKIEDNLHALELTISALRGIERWGASELMERAFQGFTALPPPIIIPEERPWRQILALVPLELKPNVTLEDAEYAYKKLMLHHHPDRGGSHEKASELNRAIKQARAELS